MTASANTILRLGDRRGARMTEAQASEELCRLGFEPDSCTPTFRIVHRTRSAETLIRRWVRVTASSDPNLPWSATTRSTFAI